MKKIFYFLAFAMLSFAFISCGDDEEGGPNNSQGSQTVTIVTPPAMRNIIVMVDANGNVSGGHEFTEIASDIFMVDGVKYQTPDNSNLFVCGYDPEKIKSNVELISTLIYKGNSMKTYVIDSNAFYGCEKLTTIMIPDGLNRIHGAAFSYCKNLATIAIPSSVQNITSSAFSSCNNMLNVVIYSSSIAEKKTLHEIFGPQVLKYTLDGNVERTGTSTFEGCGNLNTVVLSNKVEYLGRNTFSDCPALRHIYCYATTPPDGIGAFSNTSIERIKVHVPSGSIYAYQTSDTWMNFGSIVAIE